MAILNSTTLTAALGVADVRMKLDSVTGRAKNDLALIDAEIILVNRVDTDAKTLEIQRGYGGTLAEEHANGSLIWIDKADYFLQPVPSGYANEAKQIVLPRPALPGKFHVPTLWRPLLGSWVQVPVERAKNFYAIDPKTGSEFCLVKASAAIGTAARWVRIDEDGEAAISVAASVGRFGINHNVQADNDYFWAQTGGFFEAPEDGDGFLETDATLGEACKTAASGEMTLGTANSTIVFGLQVIRRATSSVEGQAYLTRPHSIGTSIALT